MSVYVMCVCVCFLAHKAAFAQAPSPKLWPRWCLRFALYRNVLYLYSIALHRIVLCCKVCMYVGDTWHEHDGCSRKHARPACSMGGQASQRELFDVRESTRCKRMRLARSACPLTPQRPQSLLGRPRRCPSGYPTYRHLQRSRRPSG